MNIEARTVSIGDDVSLVVEMAGEDEPLVLLPGMGCSTQTFHLLIPCLVAYGYRVIAVNPRGIGGSTGPLDKLTLHDAAADVAAVIAALDLAPAHVVGWAYGNRVARCVATDAPDMVQTIVLLAAGGRAVPAPEAQAAFSRLTTNTPVSAEDRLRDIVVALLAPGADPALGEWLDIGLWPDALASQRRANRATPIEDWWAGGTKPMLVIQGLEDRMAPPENGHALRDEYGDRVWLIDLPDVAHALPVEQPAAIADAIANWLRA